MGLLDKIRRVFDTGGVVVELEAPKRFGWDDPTIPVRVRVTGHGSEARKLHQLGFSLKDAVDHQPTHGTGRGGRPRRGNGRRFSASYVHLVALRLRPGESRTIEVDVPLATNDGPRLINRMSPTGGGLGLHREAPWYVLSVSATVDGGSTTTTDTVRLRTSGQFGDRGVRAG